MRKIFLATLILYCNQVLAQSGQGRLTKEQWKEDLDFVVETLKTRHYKPFTSVREQVLDSLHRDIRSKIDSYSDEQIICELSRLTSLFKWGHTRLTLPVNSDHLGLYLGHRQEKRPSEMISMFSMLPLRFVKFSEGIYVESTTREHTQLLGKKLTHIGDQAIEDVLDRISPYIAYENESARALLSAAYLSIADLLYVAGISPSKSNIPLTFEGDERLTMEPIGYENTSEWIDYLTGNDIKKPLWLKNTDHGMWKIVTNDEFFSRVDQYYWYQYLEEKKSFCIKINYLFHHPEKSIAVFMHEAMKEAALKQADKLILDLRHNRGGSADVNRAVKLALQRWPKISEFGKVFVIVGRHSYSASVILAMDLEKEFNVLLIGEELGGKPQHIGDSERYVLPNSGLTLRVSVREHHDWTGLPDRSSSWVHYHIPMTFEDYKQGIDRSLEFASAYGFTDINEEIINIYKNTNVNVALLVFYHLLTDPVSAIENHSGIAYSLAKYLYEEEDNSRYALALLQYNLEYYSEHIPSLLLLGRIQLDTDLVAEGKETLRKILSLDPDNRMAKLWLKAISVD